MHSREINMLRLPNGLPFYIPINMGDDLRWIVLEWAGEGWQRDPLFFEWIWVEADS